MVMNNDRLLYGNPSTISGPIRVIANKKSSALGALMAAHWLMKRTLRTRFNINEQKTTTKYLSEQLCVNYSENAIQKQPETSNLQVICTEQ